MNRNFHTYRLRQIIYISLLLCVVFLAISFINNTNGFSLKKQLADTTINSSQKNDILAPNARLQMVSDAFTFTEGPSSDAAGNVFFTDQPNNKIWKYGTDGKLSVFMDKAGRSNGTCFDKNGNLITCADEHNEVWSVDKKGVVTVLVKDFKGHQLNGPNDVWIDKKGGMYLTDPYFQRDYWKRQKPDAALGGEHVYYLNKNNNQWIVADSNLAKPNGVAGSADGRHLYVADIGAGLIYKYEINEDGTLHNRKVFVKQTADGITFDNKGNLYCAGDGVTVFNADGKQIAHIEVPRKWTANLCFGGADNSTLFITASEAVYTIATLVKGAE